jgi:hypothetical protein
MMTDAEIAAAIWPIYQRYVGRFNTTDTRASFCAEVNIAFGLDGQEWIADKCLICDLTNNPLTVVAANGFEFDFFFKRDGKTHILTSGELVRAHRAGLL